MFVFFVDSTGLVAVDTEQLRGLGLTSETLAVEMKVICLWKC